MGIGDLFKNIGNLRQGLRRDRDYDDRNYRSRNKDRDDDDDRDYDDRNYRSRNKDRDDDDDDD